MSIIVAGVVRYFSPTIIRGFAFGLLVVTRVAAVNIALAVVVHAQQTRTTCYDFGPTRICETFDHYGAILSKSRCYQSGWDTRCDTQTFGSQTGPTPIPLDRKLTR